MGWKVRPGKRGLLTLSCYCSKNILVRLQWPQISKGGRSNVKAERFGVLISSVKCIPKIHEEGVALPTEAILDEGVGKSCPVQEVSRGDAD
jgi:hypothetical protein